MNASNSMINTLSASIIIPTYNRPQSLRRTLLSLANQNLSFDMFEVIVVDDGSQVSIDDIIRENWLFKFSCIYQDHKGGTQAKNKGASIAHGEILFFNDDDIEVSTNYISSLISIHQQHDKAIIMGYLLPYTENSNSVFGKIYSSLITQQFDQCDLSDFPFYECMGGYFSIRKDYFFELGQLPDLDWYPNWEDLGFGYKAFQSGYKFLRCSNVCGKHYDHTLVNRKTHCERWLKAAKSVVHLFNQNPGLREMVPLFRDKTPISFRHDPPRLIIRKLFRAITAWGPILWILEGIAGGLEKHAPNPRLLSRLYRWINSSYIYLGYREGLRKFSHPI